MKRFMLLHFALATSLSCFAQQEGQTTVSGFIDVFYAYTSSDPPERTRAFTTQPLRDNEFNINLALIDVRHNAERLRGRIAYQTGTYVQSNLALEPALFRNLLEASIGVRLGNNVWVDVGVFPSHIGWEGIVSKDNWTYSRSLLADYSPYYETGVSITTVVNDNLMLRGLVFNGWQNIYETNDDKAVGSQAQYKPCDGVLLNWSTFAGNEQSDSSAFRLRLFSDFYTVLTLSEQWSLALVLDIGAQQQETGKRYDVWHAASAVIKHSFDSQWAIAGRLEYYLDKQGLIVPTGTPNNFQIVAASVNVDYAPFSNLLWRIEVRAFHSRDSVYPTREGLKKTDGFVVLSAAATI